MTGAVGPLFYAVVTVERSPVEAMADPLQDYNQRPIPIGARTELTCKWKDRTVMTTAYIQSDLASGEPCLLGTNVLMPLKLMIPDVGVEVRGDSASVGGIARVHLIDTNRIPSGNAVVVHVTAEVRSLVETGLLMVFEPRNALITEPGLYLEDTPVEPDPDGRVCLVIHNSTGNSCQRLHLVWWRNARSPSPSILDWLSRQQKAKHHSGRLA